MVSEDVQRLIEEHIAAVMAFVCSRKRLRDLVDSDHNSDWSYLTRAFFEVVKRQAARALLEFGLYVMIVDDSGNRFFSQYQREGGGSFGELIKRDGSRRPLGFSGRSQQDHPCYRIRMLGSSGERPTNCHVPGQPTRRARRLGQGFNRSRIAVLLLRSIDVGLGPVSVGRVPAMAQQQCQNVLDFPQAIGYASRRQLVHGAIMLEWSRMQEKSLCAQAPDILT